MPRLPPKPAVVHTTDAASEAARRRLAESEAVGRWLDDVLHLLRGLPNTDQQLLLAIGVRMSQHDRSHLLRMMQTSLKGRTR